MKISELIKRLQSKQQNVGDLDVELCVYDNMGGYVSTTDFQIESDGKKIVVMDKN